ncbi:UNVERIFIED_CONTAM: hypothetical protein FKN15_021700 [Acipenser sinensis]
MELKELIKRINENTAAQKELNERWEREMGLAPLKRQEREPTELQLLLQKWEQAGEAALSPEPEGVELPPGEPEGVELPSREPEGVELPSQEPEGVKKLPPPQPRPPPLKTSPVLPGMVPCPLLLDTLPVCLDLPALDLEPSSLHQQPEVYTWFPTLLSPSTQMSLGCRQMSLVLPQFAASLPVGDRTSLHRSPGKDLCPLLQSPGSRPLLQSPLTSRWGPVSLGHGPSLEVPEGPTHPQAGPWKRTKIKEIGLEGGWSFKGGGKWPWNGRLSHSAVLACSFFTLASSARVTGYPLSGHPKAQPIAVLMGRAIPHGPPLSHSERGNVNTPSSPPLSVIAMTDRRILRGCRPLPAESRMRQTVNTDLAC